MSRPPAPKGPIRLALLAAVLLVAAWPGGVATAAPDPCLACHGQPGLGLDGHPLWLDPAAFEGGVHGRLACADCHKGMDAFPHPGPGRIRCDLPCHVAGATHEPVARAVAGGVHASVADPPCLACHHGTAGTGAPGDTCQGCHPGLDRDRTRFPDTAGAFGAAGHRAAEGRAPTCLACHGTHGIGPGPAARTACSAGGCHPGADPAFGRLFDHGGGPGPGPWGGAGPWAAGLAVGIGVLLVIHSARGGRP